MKAKNCVPHTDYDKQTFTNYSFVNVLISKGVENLLKTCFLTWVRTAAKITTKILEHPSLFMCIHKRNGRTIDIFVPPHSSHFTPPTPLLSLFGHWNSTSGSCVQESQADWFWSEFGSVLKDHTQSLTCFGPLNTNHLLFCTIAPTIFSTDCEIDLIFFTKFAARRDPQFIRPSAVCAVV